MFPYFKHLLNKKNHFIIFYHLDKFHDQTVNLSEDISKRIIWKKCDITGSMIYRHYPTNTVVEKERNGNSLEPKMLTGNNKNEFFVIFNGFHLNSSKQHRKDCPRFP